MTSNVLAQELVEVRERTSLSLGVAHARKSFLANSLSNVAFIGAQAAAFLWLTSFLIGRLGIAAYGMVALVTSLTAYMAILTTALDNALSRFLVLDLERGDSRAANKTFNTALFGLVGIILALSPIALALSLGFPTLFKVPSGWERDASWLFALVASSLFVTVISNSFAVSPFIYSQFVLSNLVMFIGLAARLGTIVILFTLLPDHLWFVGGGTAIAALVSFLGFVMLWRKFTPDLHVRVIAFDLSRLRSLMGMGGWTIVNTLGGTLLSRVDLIVVNAFFGAAMTGGYGSLVQFPLLLDYLATAVANAIRPVILVKYAQQDFADLHRLSYQAVKLLGLLLALPAGLLCGFSRPFLATWLGEPYQYLSILLIVLMFHQAINLSVRPLCYVQNAYNKIRWPGIATLVAGIASLGLAVLFARWGKWGVAGVPLGVAAAWTVRNVLYVPIYTAHIMRLRWWTFLPSLVPALIGTLAAGLAAYALTLVRAPGTWLQLAASVAIVSCLYAAGVWGLGLRPADRSLLRDLLPLRRS
jgi:membrane protein EpsK